MLNHAPDLGLSNKFVQKGHEIKHINVLDLAKKFSNKSYFGKLNLSNGYCLLAIREQDRKYFGFSFDYTYYVFILCALVTLQLRTISNSFLKKFLEFYKNKI